VSRSNHSAGPFLHVTWSENGAGCVRQGLELVGRDEEVAYFSDDLAVGPLHDVDRGAASRATWWGRVDGTKVWPKPRPLDDAAIWKRIVGDDRNVVLWYGPHPAEQIYTIRACWFLRRVPARVYEGRLPPHPSPNLPAFFGAVGIAGPRAVAAAWSSIRRVRNVDARAQQWIALRRHRGDGFRELRRGRVVQLAITAHDEDLIDACSRGWTSSTLVVARVLSHVPTGDVVLSWRVRELVAAGALEGRGRRTRLGLPNEIRQREIRERTTV
jgi:hypothetical protein